MGQADAPEVHAHEDDLDGCTCDLEFQEGDETPDTELPGAVGGLETADVEDGGVDENEGCGIEVPDNDATTDEDLPAAQGGVA